MECAKLRSRSLLSGITIALFLSGSVAVAADKVVVIPLMSSSSGMITHNGISYGTVSHNGQTWLDRNLGAVRVAGSKSDSLAYGYLYQWGRGADGHESRTSPTTVTSSTSDTPGHGSFITTRYAASITYDWRDPQNDNLWQGATGINNPCPAGFRLPTEAEWETERTSPPWSSNDSAGAFASPLKLVVAGYRLYYGGTIRSAGSDGNYWSSTVNGSYSGALHFDSSSAGVYSGYRADGFSVRCLKD